MTTEVIVRSGVVPEWPQLAEGAKAAHNGYPRHRILEFNKQLKYGARIFSAGMALWGLNYFLKTGLVRTPQAYIAQGVFEHPVSELLLRKFSLEKFEKPVERYHKWLEEKRKSLNPVWLNEFIERRVVQVRLGWDAHEILVSNNFSLVPFAIRQIKSRGDFTEEDLMQYGVIGLMEAAASFDFTQGVKFSGFALKRIAGAIIDARRAHGSLIHVPRSFRNKINRMLAEYGVADSRALTILTRDERVVQNRTLREAIAALDTVSLDLPLYDAATGLTVVLSNVIADSQGSAEDQAIARENGMEFKQLIALVEEEIAALPETEAEIIRALFGRGEYDEALTPLEVAERFHLSRSRVYQLRTNTLSKLKSRLAERAKQII